MAGGLANIALILGALELAAGMILLAFARPATPSASAFNRSQPRSQTWL